MLFTNEIRRIRLFALISNEARNATITMRTDGTLMQLGRDDFQSFPNEPMIMSLEHEDADEAVTQGGKWLDVRIPSEFKAFSKVLRPPC
jgi:hypothetical protein